MNKDDLRYMISQNKPKILLASSLIFTILVVLIGIFVVKKNNSYDTFENIASKRYILADHIIGANANGKVNLYNSTNGKVVDSVNIEGNYLIDSSDNLKELYMLDVNNGDFYTIKSKGNNIDKEKSHFNLEAINEIESFDYDNGFISILCKDKKTFLIGSKESGVLKKFNPSISDDIDLFRISKDNLVFTSGEFIYSKSLSANVSNSKYIKVTQSLLKLRDKENIHGNIIAEIPVGERVEIIGEASTGWYLIKYNNLEGYVSNASSNFKDSSTDDGGVVKIHIGDKSSVMHEFNERLFIHNDFGKGRGGSILIELNPDNLYIKDLLEYKNPTNSFISNSEDNRIYTNEVAKVDDGKVRQIIKFKGIDDSDDRLGFKYTSENILDNTNTYGTLGYVYYKDNKGINIYNLKSKERDLTINTDDDFFMPLY